MRRVEIGTDKAHSSRVRANAIFRQNQQAIFEHTDRLFCGLLAFQWTVAIAAALWISPFAWEGSYSQTHQHVWAAVFLGGLITSLPFMMAVFRPGRTATRHVIGAAQMLMGALLIHLTGGRLETHFHVFGSLAFLAFYRDWRVLVSASVVVATDHVLRGYFWPRSLYGNLLGTEWRWLEHAGWVAFEDLFLIQSCIQSVQKMRESAEHQAQLEATRDQIEEAKVKQRTAELESLHKASEAAAAEARRSEQRYRHTLNAAADAIIAIDERGDIIEFNRAAETIFGYTRAELMGAALSSILPEHLRARHQSEFDLSIATDESPLAASPGMELRGFTKDGRKIPVEVSFSLLEADGRKYVTVVLRDITLRKEAEEESRRMHEENRRLLASIPSILIGLDTEARITRWNRAAETTLGIDGKQAVGKRLPEVAVAWDHQQLAKWFHECLTGQQPAALEDFSFKRADGQQAFLSISITPVLGHDGSLQGALVLGTDITQRRHLEIKLAHAQKLESVGQLAAGIAHEINTPIQYIGDNVAFLRESFTELQLVIAAYQAILAARQGGTLSAQAVDEAEKSARAADLGYLTTEIPQAIGQSLEGVQHVAKIVRAMKEFSHPDGEAKSLTDLNRAIENTITVAQNEWKYVAEVVTDLDTKLPLVPCFPGEFNQVILNMLVNAAHAIGDRRDNPDAAKGKITISTRLDADRVEIRVGDTGTGIPVSARDRIFDPFFTTKPVGKGTGQGLAISHAVIVKKHKGTIAFETAEGVGTTFIIRLPLAEQPVGSDSGVIPAGTAPTASACGLALVQ